MPPAARPDVKLSALDLRTTAWRATVRCCGVVRRSRKHPQEFENAARVSQLGDLGGVWRSPVHGAVPGRHLGCRGASRVCCRGRDPGPVAGGMANATTIARPGGRSFQETAQKNAVAVETLVGLETIKAAGRKAGRPASGKPLSPSTFGTGLKIRHVSNLGQHTIQAVQTFVQVGVVIYGFYLVSAGDMTMGWLIAATILSGSGAGAVGTVGDAARPL
jgi:ABC-type multidrug transport system fused ATPase/permease subunit